MSERRDGEEKKEPDNFTEIAKLIPFYPPLTDPRFAYNLARKKEFHDYALTSDSTQFSGLFRQQIIIQRFLAPETLYNELLIFHRVGAGKTTTALAVGEAWKTQDRAAKVCAQARETRGNHVLIADRLETPSQCPLIIVRNVNRFKKIFENELQMRFPEYQSPDATFDNNYQMESYTTAGKKSPRDYSNRVIIIDEAHNLQPQSKKEKRTEKYETLLNLLRTGVNSKKILLTGTPIPDHASQIIPLMNLILPRPIPVLTNDRFDKKYFNKKRVFIPQSTTGEPEFDLTQKFKGRVSYFRSIIPSIRRKDQGRKNVSVIDTEEKSTVITIGTTIPVVCDVMSPNQYEVAQVPFREEQRGDHFSQIARRAATMVFPHPVKGGGMKAKNKNIQTQIEAMDKDLNSLHRFSATFYSILQDIKNHPQTLFFVYLDYVNGAGGQINFGYVLQHFLNYAELGGGDSNRKKYAILGLQREVSSVQTWRSRASKRPNLDFDIGAGPRLESATDAELKAQRILNKFNAPRNLHGDDIHVLIGGQKSGEGITIKNVTRVHLIPYWHFSQSQQAVGRTIRPTSHTALIQERICKLLGNHLDLDAVALRFHRLVGLTREFALEFLSPESFYEDHFDAFVPLYIRDEEKIDYMEGWADLVDRVPSLHVKERAGNVLFVVWSGTIEVAVFHHVAVGSRQAPYPKDYRMTQDVHVFNTAAKKYAETDQVLQFLKEVSFDCPLTYPKNVVLGEKNYQCLTFPESAIKKNPVWNYSISPDQLQYDTYDLYYTDRAAIVAKVVDAFSHTSIMSFEQIRSVVGGQTEPLLGALQSLIDTNHQIPNRFGFVCCLREDRDMYFLVELRNAFRGDQSYEHAIYSALPLVTYQTSLQSLNAIRVMTQDETTGMLGAFCENPLDEPIYHKLSFNTQIRLLEGFYMNKNKGGTPPFIIALLKKNFYRMHDAVVVHVMIPKFHTEVGSEYKTTLKYTGEMRVFAPPPGGWRDAFPAEEEKYLPEVVAQDKNKPPFEFIHSAPVLLEEATDLDAVLEEESDSGLEDDD